jgi:hypothetical protein
MKYVDVCRTGSVLTALFATMLLSLAACTPLPHMPKSGFDDDWGDRGEQVFARDAKWCADAVESRRSNWVGCMLQRGWRGLP